MSFSKRFSWVLVLSRSFSLTLVMVGIGLTGFNILLSRRGVEDTYKINDESPRFLRTWENGTNDASHEERTNALETPSFSVNVPGTNSSLRAGIEEDLEEKSNSRETPSFSIDEFREILQDNKKTENRVKNLENQVEHLVNDNVEVKKQLRKIHERLQNNSNTINATSLRAGKKEELTNSTAVVEEKKPAAVENPGEEYPLQCQYSAKLQKTECCAPWDVNGDEWWLHHPDWEVSTENATSYCFAPLEKDSEKAVFLRKLHNFQWFESNCSEVEKSCEVNSGFGASTGWLQKAFWFSYKRNKPFQIMNNGRPWLYSTADNSSWAYCKERDTSCYFLPISPCSREVGDLDRNHHRVGRRPNRKEKLQYHWIKKYFQRPKQHFRRKSFELRQSLNVSYPCITMHVRRGDVGRARTPFRRFAHVEEYLKKAHAQEGDNIVLLTDAESTIQEAKVRHPEYNWIYLDRPRHEVGADVGFDHHAPSGDQGSEMLAIKVEMEVASSCQKVVHGKSGFVENLLLDMKHDGKNYTEYQVKTEISRQQAKEFKYKEFERNATRPIQISSSIAINSTNAITNASIINITRTRI